MQPKRIIPLVAVAMVLSSCQKKELRTDASYRIECQLPTGLKVTALGTSDQVTLLADTVAPGTIAEIMQVSECSGGHVFPSNFLTQLSITTTDSTGMHEVYSGVRDTDWHMGATASDHKVLVLVIE